MTSRDAEVLDPVAYPMVEAADASGRVADTYVRILERFPMVPSLFKSLAVCPTYLVLAWQQVREALGRDRFESHADALVDIATGNVPAPDDDASARLLSRFVDPVARVLLSTAGLVEAEAGRLDGPAAGVPAFADTQHPEPDLRVPPTSELDAALVGAVRRDLATPIVNSVWRYAASQNVLSELWEHLSAYTAGPRFATASRHVRDRAVAHAQQVDWTVLASPVAFERQGIADAAPGMSHLLDAYLTTLPRVLVLTSSVRGAI